jgi:hypothetical protein
MSYDIYLINPKTREVEQLEQRLSLIAGITELGGTDEAWLNVTYNYHRTFKTVIGEAGIRAIYGMKASESIPLLERAMDQLGDDQDEDYWKATEGNAKAALAALVTLAKACPNAEWTGD